MRFEPKYNIYSIHWISFLFYFHNNSLCSWDNMASSSQHRQAINTELYHIWWQGESGKLPMAFDAKRFIHTYVLQCDLFIHFDLTFASHHQHPPPPTDHKRLGQLLSCRICVKKGKHIYVSYLYGLVQDCGISNVIALGMLESCTNHRSDLWILRYRKVLEIRPRGGQGPIYRVDPMLWPLMVWQRKEPGQR